MGRMIEKRCANAGFTLVELMVTIGILLLLAGLMLGGLEAARGKAKKTRARSEIAQIVTAWTAYYGDYKRFPDVGAGGDVDTTEMGRDAVQILRGKADFKQKNPRKIEYMDFHELRTEFLDPWGNPYQVSLDTEPYDGKVSVPNETINFSVAAWSKGKDGDEGTPDDVCSWRDR